MTRRIKVVLLACLEGRLLLQTVTMACITLRLSSVTASKPGTTFETHCQPSSFWFMVLQDVAHERLQKLQDKPKGDCGKTWQGHLSMVCAKCAGSFYNQPTLKFPEAPSFRQQRLIQMNRIQIVQGLQLGNCSFQSFSVVLYGLFMIYSEGSSSLEGRRRNPFVSNAIRSTAEGALRLRV